MIEIIIAFFFISFLLFIYAAYAAIKSIADQANFQDSSDNPLAEAEQ